LGVRVEFSRAGCSSPDVLMGHHAAKWLQIHRNLTLDDPLAGLGHLPGHDCFLTVQRRAAHGPRSKRERAIMPEGPLLEVSKLTIDYMLAERRMRALDRVSFSLQRSEVLGVAGESGCGKSTLALAVIGLLPSIAGVHRGEILFEGQDLLKIGEERLEREIRGQRISMIFQNPQNALNPVFTIQKQMVDVLRQQYRNRKTGKFVRF